MIVNFQESTFTKFAEEDLVFDFSMLSLYRIEFQEVKRIP